MCVPIKQQLIYPPTKMEGKCCTPLGIRIPQSETMHRWTTWASSVEVTVMMSTHSVYINNHHLTFLQVTIPNFDDQSPPQQECVKQPYLYVSRPQKF